MPLYKDLVVNGGRVAVWRVTETREELLALHAADPELYRLANSAGAVELSLQRMAVRTLLYTMLEGKAYTLSHLTDGKPCLEGDRRNISISHTRGYVAVHLSEHMPGVDVELLSERVLRVSPKFLNPRDLSCLPEPLTVSAATLVWSAKETLYKVFGASTVDFRSSFALKRRLPRCEEDPVEVEFSVHAGSTEADISVKCAEHKEFVLTFATYNKTWLQV